MYEIFIPKSKRLQKHIYNFCVLKEFNGPVNYLAFPQLGTTIGLYINSTVTIEGKSITIQKESKRNPQIILLGKYKLPIQMRYQDFVPEVSINFTPTGLNYFFNDTTSEIAGKEAQLLITESWKRITNQIYKQDTDEKKIKVLENFLLDNLVEKDLSVVESCITLLNENPEYTILEISTILGVSTKTINRSFANYIGSSPMDFKKIVRFRKAVQTKFNEPFKNLTQICLDSNFYDSPHFTREFKKITEMNPRDFFSGINTVADKDIPYKFL